MAAGVDRRFQQGDLGGKRRSSFGCCGAQDAFAVTSLGPLRRLSNAAEKAAEARNRLSGGSFELNPMVLPQVKRLSEEMANALKSRNSWTATVAPFPNAMKADPKGESLRSSMDASSASCSSRAALPRQADEGMKGKENATPQEQQQQQQAHYNPWYSLLSCRLLGFIGSAGGRASADHEEVRNCVRPVLSSHRLSAERRFSESSMHSIRSFSLDGADSPSYMGRRGSVTRRAPSYSRRCAHEFSREDAYDRDTSFYSEMAAAPHTSIRGLSKSLDRSGDPRLSSADGKGVPMGVDDEAELERMAHRRRRAAVSEAWRRSASTDTAKPSMEQSHAQRTGSGLPTVESVIAESALDDFSNEELVRRNDIFQGRL